ncbi:polysaccharide export protein EpsE [Massilia sp. CCM 8733]|uniref:Polysaccharide export protein EpsE n=1 Tax=Massilia mucilaginosa TaxID=2609282 RepID=A0ABX0NZ22_9BURK|nr:polysaccharide export protein EpsE [Massilia mucilaginosa]NHZ92152.1 polysaccharide export protein EpsE [Massilia mucilaginosa]
MNKLVHGLMAFLAVMTMGAASAADLPLGPGDVLKVSVYGSPDLTLETRVSEGGNISYPLIGQVPVAGLSAAAAEKKIASMLEAGNFVKKPQVNVIVTAVQSQQVSVLGAVNRPGRYPIEGKRSLIDLLAMAGGINSEGGDRLSLIRTRDGKTTREEIDVIEMVRNGQLNKDYVLSGNDVLFVERAPKFYIYGEVQRPGAFRLERSMTVVQALSAGGGLSMRGTERGLVIKRRDADGKIRLIDAKQDDLLQVDDVVFVKESWF